MLLDWLLDRKIWKFRGGKCAKRNCTDWENLDKQTAQMERSGRKGKTRRRGRLDGSGYLRISKYENIRVHQSGIGISVRYILRTQHVFSAPNSKMSFIRKRNESLTSELFPKQKTSRKKNGIEMCRRRMEWILPSQAIAKELKKKKFMFDFQVENF